LLGTPPVEFISAGLVGHNNPAYVACLEAEKIWLRSENVCLVSLGTGLQRIVQMGSTWRKQIEACAQIMQDCENVHRTMYQRQMAYFRFNVSRGLHDVDIREWTQSGSHGCIAGITFGYLQEPEVIDSLDSCAKILISE